MNELQEVRVQPQNLEAEQSVLGAMILSDDAISTAKEMLKSEDFYREVHRRIFEAIVEMHDRKEPVDMITLTNELKRNGDMERVGGVTGLTKLIERVPTAANVDYYAGIVKDKAIKRAVIATGTRLVSTGYADTTTALDLVDEMQRLSSQNVDQALASVNIDDTIGTLVKKTWAKLTDVWEGRTQAFVSTGFPRLDAALGGLELGTPILLTGDPGTGKSLVVQQIARRLVMGVVPTAYGCLDTPREDVIIRTACTWAGLDWKEIKSSDPQVMTHAKRQRVWEAWDVLKGTPYYIVGQGEIGYEFALFETWIRRTTKKNRIKVAILDSAAKLEAIASRGETDEKAISRMVGRLKFIAEDLGISLIVIHETNQSEKKTPKGSGSWQFAFRYWIHLRRDEEHKRLIHADIRKNSNGATDHNLGFERVGPFEVKEVNPNDYIDNPESRTAWDERGGRR